MKRIAMLCLSALMICSLAACGSNETNSNDNTNSEQEQLDDFIDRMESGDTSLSDYEKRTLALSYMQPPEMLTLTSGETYTIELPFETESTIYTSDNDSIVEVSEDGVLTPVGDGSCIVHTDADGLQFHTVVTVEGTGITPMTSDIYTAYINEGFDAETIKQDIEVYATDKCGFTAVDSLADDEDAQTSSYPFTHEYGHSGASVKFKLLSVVDSLQEKGFTNISVEAANTDTAITCTFYYK